MKLSGDIEKLIGAEITNPEALSREAKEKAREYFKSSDSEKWELLSPTYKSKVKREEYLKAWKEWRGIIRRVNVIGVDLNSGVSAKVTFIMFLKQGRKHTATLSVIKEAGPYSIDAEKPFTIVGNTAPPYHIGS